MMKDKARILTRHFLPAGPISVRVHWRAKPILSARHPWEAKRTRGE
jgi:hypothetical protein